MIEIEKPTINKFIDQDGCYGKFVVEPLERGYGTTLGNALRRILLSSLPGAAVTSVKIDGILHEFSTIPGVKEDVTEIILNLKKLAVRLEGESTKRAIINAVGPKDVTAADIICDSDMEIFNPDLHIATLEENATLVMEINFARGRGYVPAEENKIPTAHLGTIFMDSIHTPIKNVKFSIENFRVEQKTDYEKLVLEIKTDGSIHPKDALKESARILIHHFMLFSDEKITLDIEEKAVAEEFDENTLHIRQLLKTKLVDMDLSVRALNCLKAADVGTLGELVAFNKNDLLKFRNFGKKSLTELEDLVKTKGLEFGMNVAKYKLDKE